MTVQWTRRARLRFAFCSDYLAENFGSEVAADWEEAVFTTVSALIDSPRAGIEAFPGVGRNDLRKVLVDGRRYWIYFRLRQSTIEILSIRHTLMAPPRPTSL